MAALTDNSITRVATVTGVNLSNTAKQTLYTVPPGKTFVATHVVLRNATASAATADAGFGGDAGATDFRSGVQLDNVDAAGKGMIVTPHDGGSGASPVPGEIVEYAAGADFGIKVGTTVGANIDVDVFGYLH